MRCWINGPIFSIGALGRLCLWVVVVGVFSGCAQSPGDIVPAETHLAADRVDLPTRRIGSCLFINARINGAGPFRLLVDSGAGALILASDTAAKAGLKTIPSISAQVDALHGTVKGRMAWVDLFESGGLTLRKVLSPVVEVGDLAEARRFYGQVDGILGMAALRNVVLEMDFPGERVTVVRPGSQVYPSSHAVDYSIHGGNVPFVTVDLAGRPISMMIDTGSQGSLDIPDWDVVPLRFPAVKVDGIGSAGLGFGFKRDEQGQLAGDARLGPVTWFAPGLKRGEATIGAKTLAPWKVVFDQQARRIYFLGEPMAVTWKGLAQVDPRFKFGVFLQVEGTGLRILEVDPGCAAEIAGLQVGDVIRLIGGKEAVTRWIDELGETFPIQNQTLRVVRGSNAFETVLVLEPPKATSGARVSETPR